MNAIITDLIDDHKRFRFLLTHYETHLDALRIGGEPNYRLLRDLAHYFSLFPDELHHKKEDIIYDFLASTEDHLSSSPSQGNARLHDIRTDHDVISADAAIFRKGIVQVLAGQQLPRDELSLYGSKYILTLRRHMQHEEESFFPRACASIKPEAWRTIIDRFNDLFAKEVDTHKAREVLDIEKSLLERLA
ncbi:MAG: hypothetical protein HKN14_08865 [Marinicaulis sp.]|nr:hemerythrin domain-containing protein [Marinicaulis sp.]NNE41015.1 hypothetical protein [Marinicaulis sp.]NNL87522.1 hypothetical protein [Marinicaulis sp.]